MRRQVILYQLYGTERLFRDELMLSLISFVKTCSSMQVYLVTTEDIDINYAPVNIVRITREDLSDWIGPKSYIHRAKIKAIELALRDLCDDVLYVDTDTVFLEKPELTFQRIKSSHSVMYCKERPVHKIKEIEQFIDKNYNNIQINKKSFMFNAGVIGLSREDSHLLSEVIDSTDKMNSLNALDYFHTTEQLAFSDVLSRNTNMTFACNEIFHYYRWKTVIHRLHLNQMGISSKFEFDRAVVEFNPIVPIRINPVTRAYSKLRAYPHMEYGAVDWAYYCYLEALLYRTRNREFAEAMAESALVSLKSIKPDPGLEALLKRLSRGRIDSEDWLSPEMKARWKEHWNRVEQSGRAAAE